MGTQCSIIYVAANGVKSITCHWDGYPEYMLDMLSRNYKDSRKVRALIALGDVSSVQERVAPEPGEEHTFSKPAKDTTVAYARDRGEPSKLNATKCFTCLEDAIRFEAGGCSEFVYIYDANIDRRKRKWSWKRMSDWRYAFGA